MRVMTREEYKRKWAKNWECVIYLMDYLHEHLPKEAPSWDDPQLLLHTANLTQLQININALYDLIKEMREED